VCRGVADHAGITGVEARWRLESRRLAAARGQDDPVAAVATERTDAEDTMESRDSVWRRSRACDNSGGSC
jgi:hypothetical protein